MPKIITSQLQASGTSQVFTLPTVTTNNGLLKSDAFGNLSFTTSPVVDSLTATNTVSAPVVSATTVSATTLVAPYVKSTPTSATFTLPATDGTVGQFLGTNGSGVLSFQNITISLYGTTNPTVATVANPGIVYMNTSTYEYFVCAGTRPNPSGSGIWYLWVGSQGTYIGFPQGQTAYTAVGTYSFVVPSYVSSLSAVVVGGGAGGAWTWSNAAGGGGALAYATFPVTPGETITVVVGAGGTGGSSSGTAGGYSYIRRSGTNLFYAQGGTYGATSNAQRASPVSGTVTCYGGQGGLCSGNAYGGGGGAGGYGTAANGSDAQGGDGWYGTPYSGGTQGQNNGAGSNGAGGGGIGYQSSTYGFGGGGGVGLLGRGTSGGQNPVYAGNTFYSGYGGLGGSGGANGYGNTNSTNSGTGGAFGGGGGGSGTSLGGGSTFCNGGIGGARIIWGAGRAYPATNTADVTPIN